jgi:hypothetical protein
MRNPPPSPSLNAHARNAVNHGESLTLIQVDALEKNWRPASNADDRDAGLSLEVPEIERFEERGENNFPFPAICHSGGDNAQ